MHTCYVGNNSFLLPPHKHTHNPLPPTHTHPEPGGPEDRCEVRGGRGPGRVCQHRGRGQHLCQRHQAAAEPRGQRKLARMPAPLSTHPRVAGAPLQPPAVIVAAASEHGTACIQSHGSREPSGCRFRGQLTRKTAAGRDRPMTAQAAPFPLPPAALHFGLLPMENARCSSMRPDLHTHSYDSLRPSVKKGTVCPAGTKTSHGVRVTAGPPVSKRAPLPLNPRPTTRLGSRIAHGHSPFPLPDENPTPGSPTPFHQRASQRPGPAAGFHRAVPRPTWACEELRTRGCRRSSTRI